jgi:poly-gamma-glutamate capsule biosynthesis protein CapA/YwtB (metallophosphatase superfamily)
MPSRRLCPMEPTTALMLKLDRRALFQLAAAAALGLGTKARSGDDVKPQATGRSRMARSAGSDVITLFLCGDVMAGRGVDQVMPHPSPPGLHEPYVTSALDYMRLAERANGPIPRPVDFAYPWGDAIAELDRWKPHLRIINLETSVTTSEDLVPKGINYRMHPDNIPCLSAAGIDCCVLANNHVMDWGPRGLIDTLQTLDAAEIKHAGAGRDAAEAEAPAVLEVFGTGRVLVFGFGTESSGVPAAWAAAGSRPGVNLLPDLSKRTADRVAAAVQTAKKRGDVVIASIHWGGNWGYDIPREHSEFAHGLIEVAGIAVIHGHSSHHPGAIEVYERKLILYGCGDFLNDYEGIEGYEAFRDDLVLMYFAMLSGATGELQALEMVPLQIKNFRLRSVSQEDARWLCRVLDRECRKFGTGIELTAENRLRLLWT